MTNNDLLKCSSLEPDNLKKADAQRKMEYFPLRVTRHNAEGPPSRLKFMSYDSFRYGGELLVY
ncbi:hypothetical protein TcasGA2_TC004482 [Tribolium castaneum]|uniref:Uncharacterized protein n=1 Tax=Tribolium castaneum TaxID=7070 RepID=D6WCI0_TRICA|nr:hypothetical protein TcasGA2_TC004482 [Tribolium castaneum]